MKKLSEAKNNLLQVAVKTDLAPVEMMQEKIVAEGTFGSGDIQARVNLLNQLIKTFPDGRGSDGQGAEERVVETANQALALLEGIAPRDVVEDMLAVQMVGVHNMAMKCLGLAAIRGQHRDARKDFTNQAVRLTRVYLSQMEALKKYRHGSQQKMTVEHVHIHGGGQAIVGQVGGDGQKK